MAATPLSNSAKTKESSTTTPRFPSVWTFLQVRTDWLFEIAWFPNWKKKFVTSVQRSSDGLELQMEDGEIVAAKRVILAVGITHFAYVPSNLKKLPPELSTHSFGHHDLQPFQGDRWTV